MKKRIAIFFTGCVSLLALLVGAEEETFEEMASRMVQGDVQDITVAELKRVIQTKGSNMVVLDTRERSEFEVSHIPGARWVGFKTFSIEALSDISKDATVVTYCSVGYRSERIGEFLQKAGYANVKNLKGSIFAWVNEGNSVVDQSGEPTAKVHGYSKKWAKWVTGAEVVLPD